MSAKPILILGTIFSLMPFLGLIGTFAAMLRVFSEIAVQGTGDAAELSMGISFALQYLEVGILVGIPGIVFLIWGHILKFGNEPFFEEDDSKNEFFVCAFLNIFLGIFGAHRFYVGKTSSGILFLLSLGGLVIGKYIDFLCLCWGMFYDKEDKLVRYRKSEQVAAGNDRCAFIPGQGLGGD